MDASTLREVQAPIKERYRETPEAAQITLKANGRLGADGITCKVDTAKAVVEAGLHPATGGDGQAVCPGDMLLEALAACAGVTLKAVATALNIPLRDGVVHVEGDLDFRGTLGVDRQAPVGFSDVRLRFDLDTDANEAERARLIELTERYCVVYQTLKRTPELQLEIRRAGPGELDDAGQGFEGVDEPEAALEARLAALRIAAAHAL